MQGQLDLFRALADPTRLRIVHLLREMELAVGEIALVVGQSQPRVSRHVRILVEAGLAERRKEGSWVFLSLAAGGATGLAGSANFGATILRSGLPYGWGAVPPKSDVKRNARS